MVLIYLYVDFHSVDTWVSLMVLPAVETGMVLKRAVFGRGLSEAAEMMGYVGF